MGNRDAGAAWAYHDATKHSLASLRSAPHFLDWDIMPRPFKVYTDLEPIPLAHDLHTSPRPALEAIAGDAREGVTPPHVDRDLLAHLLYFSAGVLKRRTYQMGETFFRAAACTGNLHHIDLYLACGDVEGLEAGVYHFSPHDFALRRLRAGDHRALLVEATASEPHVASAEVVVAFASTWWRNAWKYRARTYRHAFWDSGTLLANLLALAAARDLPAHLVLGFVDDAVNHLLGLDVEHEAVLGLVALGRTTSPPAPPPASAGEAIALETLPLSHREVHYPEIVTAHRAGMLDDAGEVAAWRRALPSSSSPPGEAATALPAGAVVPPEPIETVILRRGSARHFEREAIDLPALATILRSVTRGVPADFLAPGAQRAEIYLIVNEVDGLEPGAYAYDRAHDALVLLRAGRFRREAGYLGLGQQIPADAAANLFWLTDLTPVLDALGARGYRAAQLEAAIGGGKTYLAAYAQRLGASGLTFFDDDVTAFFSPHARGKSVMFLVAVGVPRRLRRARASG